MHPYIEGRPFLNPSPGLRYLLLLARADRAPVLTGSSVGTMRAATWDTLPQVTMIPSTGNASVDAASAEALELIRMEARARTAGAGADESSRSGTTTP